LQYPIDYESTARIGDRFTSEAISRHRDPDAGKDASLDIGDLLRDPSDARRLWT
jgi:hypothetical protein